MDVQTFILWILCLATHTVCGQGEKAFFINLKAFTDDQIATTKSQISEAVNLVCKQDVIGVTFLTERMMDIGIGPQQFTLSDPSCGAQTNITHYVLESNFSSCGSVLTYNAERTKVLVSNSIIVRPLRAAPNSKTDGNTKSERFIEIGFVCTFSVADRSRADTESDSTDLRAPQITSSSIRIDFYDTDSFLSGSEINADTLLKGTSVYVKISILDRQNKINSNVYIDSCYLTEIYNQQNVFYLIKDGCPADREVQFKADKPPFFSDRKFLFRAVRPFKSKRMSFSCTLKPCFKSQCFSQRSYCSNKTQYDSHPSFSVVHMRSFSVERRPFEPLVNQPVTTTQLMEGVKPSTCPPQIIQSSPCRCPASVPSVEAERSAVSSSSVVVSVEVTIAISIVMFLVGASLIGVLWFIYVRTDPRRKMHAVPMSDDGLSSSQESANQRLKLVDVVAASTQS